MLILTSQLGNDHGIIVLSPKMATSRALTTKSQPAYPTADISGILRQLTNREGGRLLNDNEIALLGQIRIGDESLLSLHDSLLYQIVNQISLYGFDPIYKYLISKPWTDRKTVFLDLPVMEASRNNFNTGLENLRRKYSVGEGQFTCGKCGSKETIDHQLQTRSADESATTHILCTNCGHKWRIS